MSSMKCTSIALVVAVLGFFGVPAVIHAQTLTSAERAQLQAELAQVEAEEAQAETQLNQAQAQSQSLSSDIAVLDAKINAAQLSIKAETLIIQSLGSDIVVKQNHISDLESQISEGRQTLADLLRKTNEIDSYSLPEVILSEASITDFFQDVDTFQAVQEGLQSTFDELQTDEASTSAEEDALTARQNAEEDARYTIQQQQQAIKTDEAQQKQLLAVSKGNEQSFSSLIADQEAKAAQIRAQLFALAGGSSPIPFGTALQYAQEASAKTGVDPAFLLAILTQESNLGKNVGTCYISKADDGSGVNAKTGAVISNVMQPTRDIPPFLTITQALGLDPYQTLVSCPQSVGWGGAMGPSQFIASTWTLIESEVEALLGITTVPDPWSARDALMAEALFMSNLGASSGSYTSELTAACRYFGGGTRCTSVTRPYGNSVMALANSIQVNQINPLQGL